VSSLRDSVPHFPPHPGLNHPNSRKAARVGDPGHALG